MLAVSWLAAPAHAGEPARVLLVAPPDASRLVSEALVRAQGELFAVGLGSVRTGSVPLATDASPSENGSPPHLPTDIYGLLILEQNEGSIVIHAWAPHATESLDARVDLGASGVTAEVVAVKAVETLRAAMLQFARREGGAVPEAVRGFTRLPSEETSRKPLEPAKPAPKPAAQPKPPTDAPDGDHDTEPTSTSAGDPLKGSSAPLGAWLGPQLALDPDASTNFGGQVGLWVGPRWGFVAIVFDTSFGTLELDAEEGDAKVQRRALTLQLGGRIRPALALELFARAGVGYAAFDVKGQGAPGYLGLHPTHESVTAQATAGAAWWLARSFGVYGSLGTAVAFDAPSVRIAGRRIATLDRPSFSLSFGAIAAVF
jgi:hypothetical protein